MTVHKSFLKTRDKGGSKKSTRLLKSTSGKFQIGRTPHASPESSTVWFQDTLVRRQPQNYEGNECYRKTKSLLAPPQPSIFNFPEHFSWSPQVLTSREMIWKGMWDIAREISRARKILKSSRLYACKTISFMEDPWCDSGKIEASVISDGKGALQASIGELFGRL